MRRLVHAVLVLSASLPGAASAGASGPALCGAGVHTFDARGTQLFPQGEIFCPLMADPKAMRSFLSYQWGDFPESARADTVGAIGVADSFGLLRIGGPAVGDGLQVSIEAAVFAQFDLKAASKDLLNSDFLVGIPVTFRRAGFSTRARLYHQSSHLGDERLVNGGDILPAGLAFEAVELVLSQELGRLRVYAGGEYLFNRSPDSLDPMVAHAGAEIRVGPARGLRLVVAGDVKSSEQQDWEPAWSARAGLEFANWVDDEHPPRVWSLLVERYDGPSPYGQFVTEDARFWGVGLHLQL